MLTSILITGKRQTGKSSLIKQVYRDNCIIPCGFVTLPINYNNKRIGFYYHSLLPVFFNNQVIIKDMIPHSEVFSTLGINTLKEIIKSDNMYVILDEVGRIERDCLEYINLLNTIIDSNKFVLAALKKEDITYINKLKQKDNILLIDLDEMSYDEAFILINKNLNDYRRALK